MKICIDPGHGPGCANGGFGYLEYESMWKLSGYLKAALERCGATVTLTRGQNEDPGLTARGKKAKGHDLFISEHSNAGGGKARGVEVFYSVDLPVDKAFAAALSKATASAMKTTDRGAKTKESTNEKGEDWLSVVDTAQDIGCPHVLLIESGFHDNATDVEFLKVDANLKLLAEIQCEIICKYLGGQYIPEVSAPVPAEPVMVFRLPDGRRTSFPAQIIKDRTYVQARALLEALGYAVGWDAATGTVLVDKA